VHGSKTAIAWKGVAVVAEDKLAFIYQVKNISEGPKNATFWRLEKDDRREGQRRKSLDRSRGTNIGSSFG